MNIDKDITIIQYNESYKSTWDSFVELSKNATFLFKRDFMEYHKDRFEDYSLLIFNKRVLVAIFPAHIKNDAVFSHEGLTYGGIIVSKKLRTTIYYSVFRELLFYLFNHKIKDLYLKEIPFFYNTIPNDEWKYLAYVLRAELYRRDLCSVLNLQHDFYISKSIIRDAKTGLKNIQKFERTLDFKLFWNEVLIPEMFYKYKTEPVHSIEEITFLAEKFPENIQLFCAYDGSKIIAGTVLFIFKDVVHVQYISGLQHYRKKGILDFIFYDLITNKFKDFNYFDFGISNEEQGTKTNKGLLFWKEGFGSQGFSQDFYKFSTKNYTLINQMYL